MFSSKSIRKPPKAGAIRLHQEVHPLPVTELVGLLTGFGVAAGDV